MSKKIIYDESLDSEIQFKKFVATQAPENHEISDEDVFIWRPAAAGAP